MTVYGLDYRPRAYQPIGRLQRLAPLVHNEFTALFRGRWGMLLFAACVFPTVIRLVMLLAWLGLLGFGGPMRRASERANGDLRQFVPTNVEFYIEQVVAVEQGFFVLLLLTAFATARAVAKDRATNALELYWTRGISPLGYFFGKWAGAASLLGLVTVAGPMLLWLIGVLFAEDWSFLSETVGFMPAACLGLLLFTALLSLLCLFVSAASSSAMIATILWCMLLGGTEALAEVLTGLDVFATRQSVSVFDAAATLARAVAGIAQRPQELDGAMGLMAFLLVALGLLARRRLRISEAIG